MPDTPSFLAERLLTEGNKSAQFFRDLPGEAWNTVIYTEGAAWKATQVLAHFTATEISLYRLLKNILEGGRGAPEDFDINSYNERKVAQLTSHDVEDLISQFLQQRTETSALVSQLTQQDLERQGRHPFLGQAPLAEIIKIIYRHNQIHQREIRKALDERV